MILNRENWRSDGYDALLRDCRKGGSGSGVVSVICHVDVDALCAARILCYLLRCDGVAYSLRPCASWKDLESALVAPQGGGGGVLVLLNVGGRFNLTKLVPTGGKEIGAADGSSSPIKMHVVDSHRPYHLANVHSSSVVLWDDGRAFSWEDQEGGGGGGGENENDAAIISDGDNLSGRDSDSSSSSSGSDSESSEEEEQEADFDSDKEEEEFDNDGDTVKPINAPKTEPSVAKRKERDSDNNQGGDEHNDDNDDNDDDLQSTSRKRPRTPKEEGDGNQDSPKENPAIAEPTEEKDDDKNDEEQNDDKDDDDDNSTIDETAKPTASPVAVTPPVSTAREAARRRRDRIRLYYAAGTYRSSPISWILYQLAATQLRFGNVPDLLWLACVGVTEAHVVQNHLDVTGYATFALDLIPHVQRLFPTSEDIVHRISHAVYAQELDASLEENLTQVTLSDCGKIMFCKNDVRFFLLRHSSLWNALAESRYVCTTLQLWKRAGIAKLQEWLAKMGLPLAQCHQPYAFLSPKLKRRLSRRLETYASEYGLDELCFTGFLRVTGYKSLLSAADMAHAITALLVCDTSSTTSTAAAAASGDAKETSKDKKEQEGLHNAFYAAHRALNFSHSSEEGSDASHLVNGGDAGKSTGLGGGLRWAMSLQRTMIATAVNLVERHAISRLAHFRYAFLHSSSGHANEEAEAEAEHHVFCHPLALNQLAHFVLDMHRTKWTGRWALPLLLLAEKPATSTFVVGGWECGGEGVLRNRWNVPLELAAQSLGWKETRRLEPHIMEIPAAQAQRFVEQLHYMMDNAT